MQQKNYIVLGQIGATFGVKGWLKVQTFNEMNASIFKYTPWFLAQTPDDLHPQQMTIEDKKQQGKSLLVKFPHFDNPEISQTLTGKFILISRSQLPPLKKDEFYWSDLEGLTVINKEGIVLGKVIYLLATGANDVLVIAQDKKKYAIPYIKNQVILKVDLANQEIQVDWELE